jgi:flagellar biosynthetic protein FliP
VSFLFSTLYANALTLDLGGGAFSARAMQLLILVTVLSLAPFMIVVMTSFTRFIIVFSFLRNALGTQQSPPNMVMTGLAFFMTLFVMEPVFKKSYDYAIKPLLAEQIKEEEAIEKAAQPFHDFMNRNVSKKDLKFFFDLSKMKKINNPKDIPYKILIPAFVVSELKCAFEIGFLIFLPFLIIDIAIASILMSLGMMMIPPSMIALPFKLIFFVAMDGWMLICGNLIKSMQ